MKRLKENQECTNGDYCHILTQFQLYYFGHNSLENAAIYLLVFGIEIAMVFGNIPFAAPRNALKKLSCESRFTNQQGCKMVFRIVKMTELDYVR